MGSFLEPVGAQINQIFIYNYIFVFCQDQGMIVTGKVKEAGAMLEDWWEQWIKSGVGLSRSRYD